MERDEISQLVCEIISKREHKEITESTTIASIGSDAIRLRTYWLDVSAELSHQGIELNGNPGDFNSLKSVKEIVDHVAENI